MSTKVKSWAFHFKKYKIFMTNILRGNLGYFYCIVNIQIGFDVMR